MYSGMCTIIASGKVSFFLFKWYIKSFTWAFLPLTIPIHQKFIYQKNYFIFDWISLFIYYIKTIHQYLIFSKY